MEKVIGVDQIRPRLGEYVNRAEKGEVWVITSRSMPKGVLIGYSRYEELKRLAERAKQLELKAMLDEMRVRAEESGLTEKDVFREIEAVRKCER